MPGILLAPYNDSMRLGQGYNSFLHTPCIHDAVKVNNDNVVRKTTGGDPSSVSQVVHYTSRFVDKISEVAKSMNISAGSSIKNGGIIASGSSVTLDESKFASSDLNAIVSVKVINQTTELLNTAVFKQPDNMTFNSTADFFRIYGNCYISGFIEGGDLTGIVSAKILDVSNKSEIERSIKSLVNSAGTQSGGDFTLSEGSGSTGSTSALSETETTITVSWSGGGQIKPEDEEWTLESLYRTAAAFPAKVAECPQRTWAILTPYNHTKNFVEWSKKHDIRLPQFEGAQSFANDLLDMYMEYKNCVNRIQSVLTNPLDYVASGSSDAIDIRIEKLLEVRAELKRQMKLINRVIDKVAITPEFVDEIESSANIQPPELWTHRLPVLRASYENSKWTPAQAADMLKQFSFVASAAPKSVPAVVGTPTSTSSGQSDNLDSNIRHSMSSIRDSVAKAAAAEQALLPAPCDSEVEALLSDEEKANILSTFGRQKYGSKFRFGKPVAKHGGGFFCDAHELSSSMIPVGYPTRVEINMVRWGESRIVGWVVTTYDQMVLTRGNDRGASLGSIALDFQPGEHIVKVRLAKGDLVWGVEGIAFIEVTTSAGRVQALGSFQGREIVQSSAGGDKFPGLKGWFGSSGDVVDRLGPIWG
ncbi:hypothetical protein QBC44DRAFT_388282 [Cladorrhinum sp. PSN332]|nr:hypothetical protein QBC44DRAFT_388282 [Cladorrhinum sp. PSN332]